MRGDEPPQGQGRHEQRPAIHAVHVDRGRLDAVVQLQGVIDIGRSPQGQGKVVHALAEGQAAPARLVAVLHQLLEFSLADKGFVQWQGCRRQLRRRKGNGKNGKQKAFHARQFNTGHQPHKQHTGCGNPGFCAPGKNVCRAKLSSPSAPHDAKLQVSFHTPPVSSDPERSQQNF